MTSVCFYFQVHQPYRLNRSIDPMAPPEAAYFDDGLNRLVMERVAERCYLPGNAVLLDAIERSEGRFRCSFSISGTALSQFEAWVPEVLDSFRALFDTGSVELLAETSHHSLAALANPAEFRRQVTDHVTDLERLFGVRPTSFRNTELILDESMAALVEGMGFTALVGEGADPLLGWRSAGRVYRPKGCESLALLLRSYGFSDDIAFRFSNQSWESYPLMADTFADWLSRVPGDTPFLGLFMDYETFGEHQDVDTGIFEFLRALPGYVLEHANLDFATPAEVAQAHAPVAELEYPRPISWADAERDLSAWLGNEMQRGAFDAIWNLAPLAHAAGGELYQLWRKLTTSDHTYYMSTKHVHESDGDVHAYFSPYESPHQAFVTAMGAVEDLAGRLKGTGGSSQQARHRAIDLESPD